MTNLKTFAGFDVSKMFFDVSILINGKQNAKHFSYDDKGLANLISWLPQDVHVVMEATGPYYLKLACHLHQHGYAVSVVNPLVIKRFSQMRLLRAKTDRADAKMIANYGLAENPPLWQPPAGYIIKLQQQEALVQQLQKQRTALLCQKEAFTASGMDKEMKLLLHKLIANLDKQIELINKRMEAIMEEHYHQLLNNVISVPGVGKKTAIALIVLSGGFVKFSNYKQLSAYIGLSPRIYESGTSVKGKARICKMGMSRIRAMLYVCAWSAKRCNQPCKELYERLVAKGKSKRLALIAVANKLIKQVFAIATNNTIYQPDYARNICF
ncbi:IS110 family transposase [Microcoleus sp. AT8-B6]|uniref:IS110 family transposase n=1 Tax=Microcoleus sp. AT8-B6 TaxID=2818622 RepID=UPI002FD5BA8D